MAKAPKEPVVAPKGNPMLQRIASAFYRTWQAVAYDTLQLTKTSSLSRVETYDAIIDYVDMYGKDKEALQYWFNQSRKAQKQWLAVVLPHERYGI